MHFYPFQHPALKLALVFAFLTYDSCFLSSAGLPFSLGSACLCHGWEMYPGREPRWTWGLPHAFPLSQESQSQATYLPMPENKCLIYFGQFYHCLQGRTTSIPAAPSGLEAEVSSHCWKSKKCMNGYVIEETGKTKPVQMVFHMVKVRRAQIQQGLGVAALSHSAVITGDLYTFPAWNRYSYGSWYLFSIWIMAPCQQPVVNKKFQRIIVD